ncbi:hypothetical protein SeLEV6574_g02228 [Synchytrium endobioticum]|uniref:Uncharacterized protein n=2 Tax=Synchytrium endobioticum TaxID=286115 RepID=A0A507D9B0_9FUNG|nr:hypothetical protein SeLEV6574_g02228 [Synchytrium endobioticum]
MAVEPRGTTNLHKHYEERTHEENQERALVAASHRGDRTIPARMESARKASELHYKRTGHKLYITEDLVAQERAYPEIDDDDNIIPVGTAEEELAGEEQAENYDDDDDTGGDEEPIDVDYVPEVTDTSITAHTTKSAP